MCESVQTLGFLPCCIVCPTYIRRNRLGLYKIKRVQGPAEAQRSMLRRPQHARQSRSRILLPTCRVRRRRSAADTSRTTSSGAPTQRRWRRGVVRCAARQHAGAARRFVWRCPPPHGAVLRRAARSAAALRRAAWRREAQRRAAPCCEAHCVLWDAGAATQAPLALRPLRRARGAAGAVASCVAPHNATRA